MATDTIIEPMEGPAEAQKVTHLAVSGMSCGNCARHVAEALQGVKGVQSATVDLEAQRAVVRWAQSGDVDVPSAIQAVAAAGFSARLVGGPGVDEVGKKLAGWRLNLWVGVPVTLALMLGEWAMGLGMTRWFQWMAFGLGTVVQGLAGARFYRGAWGQLKVGSSNMDTLVALGSTTAYGYSAWTLLRGTGEHVFFMEAAAIITLISVGHWMESVVSMRASSALRALLHLAPELARRRGTDGREMEVPVASLCSGDQIVLRPGDRVPTDGEVLEGDSAVDESMLTGESSPVDKAANDPLYAGTVNVSGRLVMRVTATGAATALAHIIEAVQRAQSSRAEIQRLGDRVSSVFVPVVVAVALGAALWWGLAPESAHQVHAWLGQFLWHAPLPPGTVATACMVAAGVLIIACPCAMGLATPAAIMAGANAAAQRGILIRDGVALEKAGQITTVLFDKTGTLTTGKPEVVAVWETPESIRAGIEAAKLPMAELAAALAAPSSHPLSQAVARLAAPEVELTDWKEVRGSGVWAALADSQKVPVRLGALRWLLELGVPVPAEDPFLKQWSEQGATLIGLSAGNALLGLIAIKDTLKPRAEEVVRQLQRQGSRVCLVTGDSAPTAAGIARQAGIATDCVYAGVTPEQKGALVQRLQQQGERVAFVGDGINDAPALERADLGIAVSRASDIAREAADIILLNSGIEAVPESLGLARATLRTIRQNLFWAFFYNAIGIPLAALGFISPILCAVAMGMSDLIVIGNALRLSRYRHRPRDGEPA